MKKYTRAERTEVLTPHQHQAVETQLHKLGKTSMDQLTEEERESVKIPTDTSK